ncbi:hypothetical protein [Ramlibacter sp.]|uniref:hypothetical protein n=1 Tax=Ramlibacter sp. TaxID=1917967 RepID=UPI001826FD67|nr:hypothetical protein [Ramlibacter sp.]MBA2675662.1 hypothetical protein [Ramlibacter sp.]
MNVTKTISLQLGSTGHPAKFEHVDAHQDRRAERKALVGSGCITTHFVAEHVRKTMAAGAPRAVEK